MRRQPIIEARGLTKRYGKKTALDRFECEIPAGSVVGVLGPNGCGKSSFFRALTGLVRPDEGSLEVLGAEPGFRTNGQIAYLPDRARWYPNQTAAQAFAWGEAFLPGFELGRAMELAEYMDVEPEMKMSGMSRGQEARVLLILCLARNVPLLILDEPFAGIDLLSREAIVAGMIAGLEDREQTVLISTHDINEVEGLFDYAVMMNKGRAVWAGETEALRAEHGSLQQVFRQLYAKEWKR